MPTGALVGATLGSAVIGAGGAVLAAGKQAKAARRAAEMQMQMFDTVRGDLAPYRSVGSSASTGLAQLLGLSDNGIAGYNGAGVYGTPSAAGPQPDWTAYLTGNPDIAARATQGVQTGEIGPHGQWATPEEWAAFHYSNSGKAEGRNLPMLAGTTGGTGGVDPRQAYLENTPGYQFARDQGMKAVTNSLSARGLGGASGAFGKGLARFVTGLADQTYGENVARFQSAATMGANAAAQTGSLGVTSAANAGGNIVGAGNAAAAGYNGVAGSLAGGLQGAAGAWAASKMPGMYAGGIPSFGAAPSPGYTPTNIGYTGAGVPF